MKTKILLLFIIFTLLFVTIVNAANIDTNLSNSARPSVQEDENDLYSQDNDNDDNNYLDESAYDSNYEEGSSLNATNKQTATSSSVPSVKTTTTTTDQDFFTVENILSIALIVIGILLVLLGIAILIRFK